ncbi:preprotein translocase subunit TatB [Aurantiacibacter atlanticus]|uniref:Sec-independent protein translocase protein TatB n=1 Tax=Aurantiacibacter atlanticus TaxID=1648404 RepID=A0A0H4VE73_9SPHN|nr:Sec-independent protein translocase protein TatB [Aurantiacibacter atlanticus]AKQ42645.1 preprotein translocase subunit TatB [Aurantiacibacter atlanticus]MDF1834958.1 Sec-independent protein translocase protein TatB [Alteraurantiacibacter sp. bin_em_oilr2.035]
MFDIGATELLLIAIVAILVIGPKDMPLALRTVGRWVGKLRKLSAQFRAGFDGIVREAEMEEMEKKWKAQNEKIMREHPDGAPVEMEPTGAYPPSPYPHTISPEKREELERIAAKERAAAAQHSEEPASTDSAGDASSAESAARDPDAGSKA